MKASPIGSPATLMIDPLVWNKVDTLENDIPTRVDMFNPLYLPAHLLRGLSDKDRLLLIMYQ